TPMAADAVVAVVDAIFAQRVALPGVNGEAATAARFAGHWAERTKMAARPVEGQRLYEVDVVVAPPHSPDGGVRPAAADDRDLLLKWFAAFHAEVGQPGGDPRPVVDRRLAAGQRWM